MECTKDMNIKGCTCSYPCDNRGRCCDCVAFHRGRNEFPACFFSQEAEKTYDRSFGKLCEDRKKHG